jgi:V8-like Glu-specific endopeptidase
VSYSCGGTLIDKSTILTASHCIIGSFDQTINGTTYILPIELNDKYPTYESMLTVYLGIHDLSNLGSNNDNNISPVVKMKVSRIIKVKHLFFYFCLWILILTFYSSFL